MTTLVLKQKCSHKDCQQDATIRVHYKQVMGKVPESRIVCNAHYETKVGDDPLASDVGLDYNDKYYQIGMSRIEVIAS